MNFSPETALAGDHPISCPQVDASRFWAVLIGIDTYPSSPLRGCVNDANKIAQYLMEDLGVAEDHIQRLLSANTPLHMPHTSNTFIGTINNGVQRLFDWSSMTTSHIDCMSPTRANIIASLLRLSTDSRIKEGDNILIHFSGHGSKYFCSDYPPYKATSAGTGTIEVLCPIDRDEGHGGMVPDISDREINVILSEISRTKGHRITLILDCCHSSGLTRVAQGEEGVRAIRPLPSSS
ncbi:peptidase C14, caspase domain-containing protein, partial [Armillaria nabsnona]